MKLSLAIQALFTFLSHALQADMESTNKDGSSMQSILNQANTSELYQYPTDLTQDIIPVPVHSHNDYWRSVPFFSALSLGCVSVEADVWLVNKTLYVGHERSALTSVRTLHSLYIQPLLDVLRRQNSQSAFVTSPQNAHGVFDVVESQTFYLWIDVKTNGTETWPYVVQALQPLRDAGYLTRLNSSGGIVDGPVTVIGTGSTPLNQIQNLTERDYFWDAPAATLGTSFSNITSNVSPIASTNFAQQFGTMHGGTFNETQLTKLRSQIAVATSKGIMVRYWNTPAWPISARNSVWETLVTEGIGILNADDLRAAAGL